MTASDEERTLTPFQRLRRVLSPEKADLWVVVVYGLAVGALSLAVPIASQALVTWAAFGTVVQPVVVLALLVFGLLFIDGAFFGIQVWITENVQQRVFARMAIDIAWRLPRARWEGYRAGRPTELVNRFLDVMTIRKATALILLDGFALALQSVSGMVLLALYSPLLLGFAALLLLSIVFVIFVVGRGAVHTSIAESRAKYEVVAWLEEIARVPLPFRAPANATYALDRTDELTVGYLHRRKTHFRILFRQILGSLLIQAVASAGLLGLGGLLIARQQLTLGQLVAAELVVTPLVGRFARIGKYLESFYDLLAAVEKVGMIFDVPLEREKGEVLPAEPAPLSVMVRGVGWKPRTRTVPVLENVELSLSRGERVLLVGRHGSGKSALVDLLLGYLAPSHGTIEFEGIDVREVDLAELRSSVALVRNVEIFDGTLLDNVRLGREDVRLHDVRHALERLQLLDLVASLPDGLQTRVTGELIPFSTGEALRLMFARAIVARPRLLVVDEALDAIQEEHRAHLLEVLLASDAPWTVVVTSHVSDLGARFDRAYRIEGRTLTREGLSS